MQKKSRISLAFSSFAMSAALLAACGDDNATSAFTNQSTISSSSVTLPSEEYSSSSTEAPTSSSPEADSSSSQIFPEVSSSSAVLEDPLSSSSTEAPQLDPSCVETPVATIALDTNGLADIADVFKSVRCNEKAVFIIRHGERDDAQTGRETPLTYYENEPDTINGQPSDGVRQAQAVGKKLISNDEFIFSHTNYVRTEQTCLNIAIGRGQTTFPHDTTDLYSISWFRKDKERYDYYSDSTTNVRLVIAGWAFDNMYADAFYDLAEKSAEIVKKDIAPDYASMRKFRVICTHDDFVLPFSVYVTNGNVNYKFHVTYHWPYFLTGVAVIIDNQNQIRYVPFRGLGIGVE